MDPISQGVVGAVAGHLVAGRRLPRAALIIGAGAGMAPDLDVFLPTFGDLTAGWVYHRGPTHALAAILPGGLLASLPFLILKKLRKHWRWVMLAAVAGVATHGPLDALTTYGTVLFWPFSDYRAALDVMPIVDPIFTLPLVALAVAAFWRKSMKFTAVAAVFAVLYVLFATAQHARAVAAVEAVAASRGHADAANLRAVPSPFAPLVWRGIYEHGGELHAVGVRTGYGSATTVNPGGSRPLATIEAAGTDPEARRHYAVFDWFNGGTGVLVGPERVGDGRYSGEPASFAPLWGLDFSTDPPRRFSGFDRDLSGFFRTMRGRDPAYGPVPE